MRGAEAAAAHNRSRAEHQKEDAARENSEAVLVVHDSIVNVDIPSVEDVL